jgi:hypothetical protein
MNFKTPERQAGMPLFSLARYIFISKLESLTFPARLSCRSLFIFTSIYRASSGAMTERGLRVIRIKADGRCMFRSIAVSMARNQGRILGPAAEEQEADQLRLAVAEALCRTHKRRNDFGDAVIALEAEDNLQNYCKRIMAPTFWGGEPELIVLSKMLKIPIFIYLTQDGSSFIPIQKYGEKFTKAGKDWVKRRPVRLLYVNGNHYEALVK